MQGERPKQAMVRQIQMSRSRLIRDRVRRSRVALTFAFLLLAVTAAPVLADQTATPEPGQDISQQMPSTQTFSHALIEAEREWQLQTEERERQLGTPTAELERTESRTAYADLTGSASQGLLAEEFPEQLQELNSDPARVLSGVEFEEPLGSHAALVASGDGHSAILESPVPVESDESGEKEPVDLSLERSGETFQPQNPLTPVELPDSSSGAVELGNGTAIVALPGSGDATAEHFGDKNLFFHETGQTTDTMLAPIATGVEVYEQLRSPESPEQFRYVFSLPSGDRLRSDGDGGAEVVDGAGSPVTLIPVPSAVDAQGTEVPTMMTVEGDSILIEVAHHASGYDYPILLDPVLEGWEGWWEWWNLGGLDYWGIGENAGSGANYEYSKPGSITDNWGPGLYVRSRGENVSYAPNSWVQWVYTARNSTAFISRAVFQPVNGDSHNCSTAQPHGYAGIFNVNTNSYTNLHVYSPPGGSTNYDSGWVGGPGARFAVMGIGTGNSWSTLACGHDFYVGGASIWEEDRDQPELHSAGSAQWMDSTPVQLSVWAKDTGVGMKDFVSEAANTSGGTESWETGPRCNGWAQDPCGEVWDLSPGNPNRLNYNPAVMPEGIDNLKITAYDATDEPSSFSDTVTVRVDHAPPSLTISGTVTEQATLGTSRPIYTLEAVAKDGVHGSEDPTLARSGVKNLRIFEDGGEVEPGRAQPECIGTQSCQGGPREYEIDTLSRSVGQHHILVTAEDALGHKAQKEITYEITRDTAPPKLSLIGMPAPGSIVSAHPGEVKATATDAGGGVTSLAMLVDGEVVEEETQGCPRGGCSFETGFGPDLTEVAAGEHTLEVKAKDAQGNVVTSMREVVVDPTPPTIRLEGRLAERDGQPLDAETGTLKIEAGDPAIATEDPPREEPSAEGDQGEGPVASYSLNEGSGEVAHDSSGHHHDATIHGAQWTGEGRYGGALHFDAADHDRLTIPASPQLDFTGPFTLEAWVKPEEERRWAPIFAKTGAEESELSYLLYARDGEGKPEGQLFDGKEEWSAPRGPETLPQNAWTHLALVFDGTDTRLYVDGKAVATNGGKAPQVSDGALEIGGDRWGEYFDGEIDEVRVYGRALDSEEVQQNRATPVHIGEGPEPTGAGVSTIRLELDEEEVAGFPVTCSGECIDLNASYLYSAGSLGPGPHTLNIEAVDALGNTSSRTLTVDAPAMASTPACNAEVAEEPAKSAVSVEEATESIEEVLPEAVAPTKPGLEEMEEEEISPTYSEPSPNLESEESMADSETSVEADGGISLQGVACLSPGETTYASTDAHVVNEDSAVFANTGAEVSTVVRPTATGVMVIRSIEGPEAAETYSWNVKLREGEELVELPSGTVAIVEPTEEGDEAAPAPEKPKTIEDPTAINDAEAQRLNTEYEIATASTETSDNVIGVIPKPWVLIRDEEIIPAPIAVAPVIEEPNEFVLTVHLPDDARSAEIYPVQVVEQASISTATAICSKKESPCGGPSLDDAAQYAVFWGNPNHVAEEGRYIPVKARNPYYQNFGDDNCTNFISQILRAGGQSFMRYLHHGDGSWWYHRAEPWTPGNRVNFAPGEYTQSWVLADLLPRHLWQYGLVHIDPVNEPYGWTKGDILAEDWFSDGRGDFGHLQFVVGTATLEGTREPLIANESSEGSNYGSLVWWKVRQRIQAAEPGGWERVPLAWKHTAANLEAKKHDPDNLYGPDGVFHE